MITSDKIFKLVETFERVLPCAKHEGALNMSKCDVSDRSDNRQCGTTHCHAGWYALAKEWDLKSPYLSEEITLNYWKGKSIMEKDLGFFKGVIPGFDCQRWAKNNPKIWGNGYGEKMFSESKAFNYEGELTLQKIVDHWREVGIRLKAQEVERSNNERYIKHKQEDN